MKNTKQFELPEMKKIEIPSNVISQEVGKVINGYGNLVENLLELNSKSEILPFEEELAERLGVLYKVKKFIKNFGKLSND